MEIKVIRKVFNENNTLGILMINDSYLCDTLEDTDRGLDSGLTVDEILKIKIKGKTAIPKGIYNIDMKTISPKFNQNKYKWAVSIGGLVPRLLIVKGFNGVLIHPGNSETDTEGCILVGERSGKATVINSQLTFKKLYKILKEASDNEELITLSIE